MNGSIKVLHICQRDDVATGGAAKVAVEYVNRLGQYGIDAQCLFLYGEPDYFAQELGDRAHYLRIENSREIHKFGRLFQFIRAFQPQILHCHHGLLWPSLIISTFRDVFKITHAHLGAIERGILSKSALAEWIQRRSTDLLLCITEDTQSSQIAYAKYLPEKTKVLRNGVDTSRFYPATPMEKSQVRAHFGIPEEAFVVGFVGRLHCAMKGTDDFIRMFSLLPSDFWALVVGDGVDAQMLKSLSKSLGVECRVVFTGTLKQTLPAYQAISTFCLTSHNEPFGLVLAEAMACKIPVVGFECIGGAREILTPQTGCIVLNRDIKKMASVVAKINQEPSCYRQQQQRASALVKETYSWQKNSVVLSALYKQIVQETK